MKHIVGFFGTLLLLSTSVSAKEQFFIKLKGTDTKANMSKILSALGAHNAKLVHEYELIPGLLLAESSSDSQVGYAMAAIQKDSAVEYVEKSYRRNINDWKGLAQAKAADPALPVFEAPPTVWTKDPKEASNYGTGQNNTRKVWEKYKAYGTPQTIIAVIDTGVDYTHKDLSANMWRNSHEVVNGIDDDGNGYIDDVVGYDFVNNDPLPYDDHGHGTHVAGIAAAVGGNGTGIAGHCPRCSIMALKFLAPDGSGTDADAILAIEYATKMGAIVANSSWGGVEPSKTLEEAFSVSANAGVIHVVAAGNDGKDLAMNNFYPAKYKSAGQFTVAALYPADVFIPVWSNYSQYHVQVSCGGSDVYSTVPKNQYRTMSGTSMASPGIAGSVALVKSYRPAISNQELHRLFDKHAIPDIDSIKKTIYKGRPNMLAIFGEL